VSVYCLANLLGNRHRYDESTTLYERACAGYSTVLGKDHPTTRACRRHYSQMLASQEQDRLAVPSDMPQMLGGSNARRTMDSGVSIQESKESRLSRRLARLGIRRSKIS
jgi:hypothetical protein